MFSSVLWRKRKKLPENEQLSEVVKILFPEFTTENLPNGDIFQVDESVDNNLEAALIDLQTGENDKMIQSTIQKAINRLRQVRSLLEVQQEINPDARAIIFEMTDNQEITANEE